MTIAAKHQKLRREHFLQLAARVPQGEEVMDRFVEDFRKQRDFTRSALDGLLLTQGKKEAMIALMEERLSRF